MIGETAAFLEFLYGDCASEDGSLVLVSHTRKTPIGVFDVGDGGRLVSIAKAAHRYIGCYYKTQLMDGDAIRDRAKAKGFPVVGKRDEVKTIIGFSLDVDAGKSEKYQSRAYTLLCLEDMPVPPTLIVNSGGRSGGFHVTWKLKKPHRITDDREEIQEMAHRWCALLKDKMKGKLDKTSNLDRVLRVVGVERKDGELVFAEQYHPERLYSLEDLAC